jgi:hypothetical protein
MEAAAQKFRVMDGKVDAFGVGGADLGMMVEDKWYPLYSVHPMIRFIKETPVVCGAGIKTTLERRLGKVLESEIGDYVAQRKKRVLVTAGADRWGQTMAFWDHGYECVFGDIMFSVGLPIPLRSPQQLKMMVTIFFPIVSRLPFAWLYPTGEKQETRKPKWEKYYQWATVIAGDLHYIVRHMPDRLDAKVVVTNTTTLDDVNLFREAGVKYLVTSTPVISGRSFGTNMMEAALTAIAGKGRKLTEAELTEMLDAINLEPQIRELN